MQRAVLRADHVIEVFVIHIGPPGMAVLFGLGAALCPVSYTHLDVYKRQTRYRFDKVKERAKLKSSVARLVNILFPELEKLVSSLHIAVVYALLSNYPGASYIANANTEMCIRDRSGIVSFSLIAAC